MIPTNGNQESVAARLFVSVAAIERIARDLWWHATMPLVREPGVRRGRAIGFDGFLAFDELVEVCADCERLLRRLDESIEGVEIRCAGELVTRAEAAVLLAHVTALRGEIEDSSRPDEELRQRVRGVHERVRDGLGRIHAMWAELPSTRDAQGAVRAWTFDDYHAYLVMLQTVRRSLLELKRDPSLRVLVLAGTKHANSWIGTTCQLMALVLDFQIEPDVWGRITPHRLRGKK